MSTYQKRALVLGAGGFIGTHLVTYLRKKGYFVAGADLKRPQFSQTDCHKFELVDLRDTGSVSDLISEEYDEIYQLAADMGGAGFVFTGENDSDIMHNSASINLNVLDSVKTLKATTGRAPKLFYSSSACIYPERNQTDPLNPLLSEESAYPAEPDSEYGWEKLFSERLYLAYARNHDLEVRIARYHNIFGPLGTWEGGREKSPAAISRKVALATDDTSIEVWGDGKQTRSFLYVAECVEASFRLMQSNFVGPVNIGSEEMVSINDMARILIEMSGKNIQLTYKLDAPVGVRGRNSDNRLIRENLGWDYSMELREGLKLTYDWIWSQIALRSSQGVKPIDG